MILDFPTTQPAAFQLAEELREPGNRLGVRRVTLDDPAQEELLLRKLGTRGWGRVHYFRNHFETGWGEHQQGRSLSPRAFEAFLRFVGSVSFPDSSKKPSVFLADSGGIELCWEDVSGHAVQVEFTRDGAEYFLGASEEEGSIAYSEIGHLSALLSA